MSTLTKVLIVLLTLSSICLCGIVGTYVSNALNYKEMYTKLRNAKLAAEENETNAKKQLNLAIEEAGKQEQKLKGDIKNLNIQVSQLETQLAEQKRKADEAVAQENVWKVLSEDFLTANKDLQTILQGKLDELTSVDETFVIRGSSICESDLNSLQERLDRSIASNVSRKDC